MGLETGVFLMVLASSMMHASWNLVARKVKGDQAVLALGQLFPNILLLPIIFFVDNSQPLAPALPYVIATGVLHIGYIFALGFMYAQAGGNVSVVYPVARGSGVAMTVLLAGPLLGETLSIQAYLGILAVILGVVAMGFSSKTKTICELRTKGDGKVFPSENVENAQMSDIIVQNVPKDDKNVKLVDDNNKNNNGGYSLTSNAEIGTKDFSVSSFSIPPDVPLSNNSSDASREAEDGERERREGEERREQDMSISTVSPKTAHVLLKELNKTLSPTDINSASSHSSELLDSGSPPLPSKGSNLAAIGLALFTGVFICGYSLVDKTGVGLMNPVTYEFGMLVVENIFYIPFNFLSAKRREASKETMRVRKFYCFVVGVGSMATYFIILYAFTLSHASFIVALRECAVVWGALFGVLFLKERFTVGMLLGISLIVTGVILMKTDGTE